MCRSVYSTQAGAPLTKVSRARAYSASSRQVVLRWYMSVSKWSTDILRKISCKEAKKVSQLYYVNNSAPAAVHPVAFLPDFCVCST